MNDKERNRVEFFSKEDTSCFYHLQGAEKILNNYNPQSALNIIDLLEFYNIKLYFKNNLFLTSWTEETINKYSLTLELTWDLLKENLINIDEDILDNILDELQYNYIENLWELINNLNIYKKFSSVKFEKILDKYKHQTRYIISQKGIVSHFDKEIRNHLLSFKTFAELLLSKLEEKHTSNNTPKYFFPKSLTLIDKENIVIKYLKGDDPSLNYVRLINNSKDSGDLKLSPKTRLRAKRKAKELNDEILEKGNSWNIGVQVTFSKQESEPVIYKNNKGCLEVIYNQQLLDELKTNKDLFNVFKSLFVYMDDTNLIDLVSKSSELDVLERIFMESKNSYEIGEIFHKKENLSLLQLLIFQDYLQKKDNSIENLIESFLKHLNSLISPSKLTLKLPNSESSYVEKIRHLNPEFEFLLKQYKTYVEESEIDIELIQISSVPIRFSKINSLANRKYIYIKDGDILRLKHLFFSDQSNLYYTEKFKTKYHNFYDLINYENVRIEDFGNYQKDIINNLIREKHLKIDNNNNVKVNNDPFIYIIRELNRNEVINYWNYPRFIRNEIDKMLFNKLLRIENTLLSVKEKNYFNFYLNKKEYTNGYDLRNKYSHGTNSFSENENKRDYYALLKLIILSLFKIEDDIIINQKLLTLAHT